VLYQHKVSPINLKLIMFIIHLYFFSLLGICPRFEYWNACASACLKDSCQKNPIQEGRVCTLQCVQRCVCMRGRFRRISDGRCVLPQNCWNNIIDDDFNVDLNLPQQYNNQY
jgi:hypothetical protein